MPALVEVAQFGKFQPIGLAVSKAGRIFVTFPKREQYEFGLAEIKDGKRVPYPDTVWNKYDTLNTAEHFTNVQALWTDKENKLWVLDPANPSGGPTIPEGVKLLKIDIDSNRVERIYRFEDLRREQTALNDVRIDNERQLAYLSDPKQACIVVLNLKTGKSRLVLKNEPSTKADTTFVLNIDGKDVINQEGKAFSSNVNGLAFYNDYLFFRPINQTKLYRISASYLADSTLSGSQLTQRVEHIDDVGVSHGMIADEKGNIYLSDSPDNAIRYVTRNGTLKVLIEDKRLTWPDSFAIGPDNYLYVTCSQINRTPAYNNGEDRVEYPFRLFKVKLPE
ncbi:gluconolactonase [Pedobacter sp. HMF7647]|uniref:Gluconolactonase n=2 Tax=Hufsiella arboris TaxID=2695275 RepID=A0A7K1YBX5_9SPHI|nr:gluconolactonase [Hufsiella arboris]